MDSIYKVTKSKDNWYRLYEQNVFMELIIGEQKALLIDTGFGSGDLPAEIKKITDKPLIVVNTHHHPDHNGANSHFERITETKDGDVIDLGGATLQVIATPGHTADGKSYLWKEEKILFVGDAANPFLWLFGLGATSRQDVIESYDKIATLDIIGFFAAHAPVMLTQDDLANYRRAAVEADWEKGVPFNAPMAQGADARICALPGFGPQDFDKPGFASIVLGKGF